MIRQPTDLHAPRMDTLARLPVFYALEGKRALVAGGSLAAAWKAELLCAAGARVEVFARQADDDMLALVAAPPNAGPGGGPAKPDNHAPSAALG